VSPPTCPYCRGVLASLNVYYANAGGTYVASFHWRGERYRRTLRLSPAIVNIRSVYGDCCLSAGPTVRSIPDLVITDDAIVVPDTIRMEWLL
jgi:hypothetical protein